MNASKQTKSAAAALAVDALPRAALFPLVRYFLLTSFIAFLSFAAALLYFEHLKIEFFRQVQQEQNAFFAQLQDSFLQRHDPAAGAFLLRVYETGNINLGRLFSNTMWERDFAPFVTGAQRIPVDQCRAIADVKDTGGKTVQSGEKQACYAGIGRRIMALPEFRGLDARVFDTMRKSTVFKIKVFDLRGITVYSSEHKQIGEDKTGDAGWASAAAGKTASALTHRDQFSAFEGVVVDRDLVSTYLPVLAPGSENIVGVFEVYSDVTPFLAQIDSTSSEIRKLVAANHAHVEQAAAADREKLDANSNVLLAAMFGTLALLYLALFLIVRNAQRIIGRQEVERRRAATELARQRDLYGMLSHTNQAIVRMTAREDLLASVCRTAVEHGRFRFAWFGLRNKSDPRVKVAARHGDDAGYIDRMLVSADASDARGRGPTGQALRAGEHAVSNDFLNDPATSPWHDAARLAGLRASAAFPIREGGEVIGALGVYADEPGFFTAGLIATLDEVATDVSFALDNLAREAARLQAVEALRTSEERFRNLLRDAPSIAVQGYGMDGVTRYWNRASELVYGYTEGEAIGRPLIDLIIPPEMRSDIEQAIRHMSETRQPIPAAELSLMRKDGSRVDVFSSHAIVELPGHAPELFCIDVDLTSTRRAEQALRESDARTQLLVKSSNIGLWDWNLLNNEVFLSPEWKHHLGYADHELPNRYEEWESRLHPEDRESALTAVKEFRDGRRADYEVEFRLRHKDGSWRCILTRGDLVRDAAGQPARMMGCHIDITERKRSEQALRESEARYRSLFASSEAVMLLVDPADGSIVEANPAACAYYGYEPAALLAMKVYDINVLGREQVREEMDRAAERSQYHFDFRHRLSNGEVRDVQVFVSPVEMGGRSLYFSIVQDVTERLLAGRALVEAEARFRGLVEQSIAGIYIIQDGKFAYVNPRMAEIHGYESERELIDTDPLLLIAENDVAAVRDIMHRLFGGSTTAIDHTLTARRKDGSTVELGLHSARASYCGRLAVIGMMQDISEKKHAEEQIQNYVAQLETAFMSTVGVATTLSEMRDPYTAGHERRVAEIAVAIGAELGFDARRQEGLRVAGYLHDIGKITIPAEILSKPGKLSPIEYKLIQGHPQASYEVLKNVAFPWPVAGVALQHHERIDGSGYPQGLKGEAILLEARIVAVADVVEAMSSHRPYRPGLGIDKALAEIERGRGTAYDPVVADACLKLFREKSYALPA